MLFDSEEMLDVVDDNDQVIAVKSRREIHAQGLIHRSAHVLVFNCAGDVFLQKRALSKQTNPGLWDSSAAGHVNSGESYYHCILREIREELGVTITQPCKALCKFSPLPATGMEHCMVYHTVHNGPFELDTDEIDAGKWVTPAVMDSWVAQAWPELTQLLGRIWLKYRAL